MPTNKRMVAVYFDTDQHALLHRAAARQKISAGRLLQRFIDWHTVKKMERAEELEPDSKLAG